MARPRTPIEFLALIESSGLIAGGDRLVVAVSGGADSMALLDALCELRGSSGVAAATFDHRLRETSARDVEGVTRFCARRNVECLAGAGDVRARARDRGESIEEAARKLRYQFLAASADRFGADLIATGHTLDDQIETVLMRLARGSGVRGVAGIPARRGRIVRPILGARRRDTEAYCRDRGVPVVDDASNRDVRFERNRIRHEVLPALRESHPGVDDLIVETSERVAATLREIRATTSPVISSHLLREGDDVWRLPVAPLEGLDDTALYVLFADMLADELACDADAGRCHYDALRRLARGELRPGAGVSLPRLNVRREHDGLVFSRRESRPRGARRTARAEPPRRARLAVPGSASLPGVRVRSEVVSDPAALAEFHARQETGRHLAVAVAYFAQNAMEPPLCVRRYQRGDKIQPFGMRGHKKLSDIFIDRKIAHRRRCNALVVEDRRGLVWLVGVTTSEATRVRDATEPVVRITVETTPVSEGGPWVGQPAG